MASCDETAAATNADIIIKNLQSSNERNERSDTNSNQQMNQTKAKMWHYFLQELLNTIACVTRRPRLANETWDESMRQQSRQQSHSKIPWLKPLQLQQLQLPMLSAIKRTALVFRTLARSIYEPKRKKPRTNNNFLSCLDSGSFSSPVPSVAPSGNLPQDAMVVYQPSKPPCSQSVLEYAARLACAMLVQWQEQGGKGLPSVHHDSSHPSSPGADGDIEAQAFEEATFQADSLLNSHPLVEPFHASFHGEEDFVLDHLHHFDQVDSEMSDARQTCDKYELAPPQTMGLVFKPHQLGSNQPSQEASQGLLAKGVSFSEVVEIAGVAHKQSSLNEQPGDMQRSIKAQSDQGKQTSKKDRKIRKKERKEKRKRKRAAEALSKARKRDKTTESGDPLDNATAAVWQHPKEQQSEAPLAALATKENLELSRISNYLPVDEEKSSSKRAADEDSLTERAENLRKRIMNLNRYSKKQQRLSSVHEPFRPRMIKAAESPKPAAFRIKPPAHKKQTNTLFSESLTKSIHSGTQGAEANYQPNHDALQQNTNNQFMRSTRQMRYQEPLVYANHAEPSITSALCQPQNDPPLSVPTQVNVLFQPPHQIYTTSQNMPSESKGICFATCDAAGEENDKVPIRVLCSENFLETWSDLVADLGSGHWKALAVDHGADQLYVPPASIVVGRQIELIDSPLIDTCGVDIELPGRVAVIVHSLAALENEAAAKEIVLDLARVVAGGRYRCIHVIICCDVSLTEQMTRHVASLQAVGLRCSSSGSSTSTHFKMASQVSISACIAATVFEASRACIDQGIGLSLVLDIQDDTEIRDKAKFLITLIPMLTASGAIQCLQLTRRLAPGVRLFPYVLESDSFRNEISKMASCDTNSPDSREVTEISPAALEYLRQLMMLHL